MRHNPCCVLLTTCRSICTVHIDYGNRPEASAEADFVRRYCESLDIDFRCRRIEEVTRGITSRDDYERISREIRYNSYREAVEMARSEVNDNQMIVGVMLGHHRGDLRENVLSNAHKGSGPLDLSGMTAISQNDGVTLYRPLLPLEKNLIFDYAHTFGVPYFKGTCFEPFATA
jgi:tRNA(Ile)-lysidine synthase TilS/MesJ